MKKRSGGKKTRRGLISLRSASFEIVSAAPTDYPSRVLRSRAPVAPPLPALEVVNSSTDAIYSFPRRHPPNFTFNSKIVFLLHPNLLMFLFLNIVLHIFIFLFLSTAANWNKKTKQSESNNVEEPIHIFSEGKTGASPSRTLRINHWPQEQQLALTVAFLFFRQGTGQQSERWEM